MPRTEIDDIFASSSQLTHTEPSVKVKGKAVITNTNGAVEQKRKKKKKKKKKKVKTEPAPADTTSSTPNAKRKRPEMVLDPSASLPSKKPKTALPRGDDTSTRAEKSRNKPAQDEEKFRDSRGTGPRKKTEEGFSVYKEDELGIGDEGGGTPLCPFDCDCCF